MSPKTRSLFIWTWPYLVCAMALVEMYRGNHNMAVACFLMVSYMAWTTAREDR